MANEGIHAHGTTLAGATAGTLANITSIDIDGQELDDLDISTMGSTNKWRQFIAGMKDPGTINVELVYDDNQEVLIYAGLGVSQVWTITFPDGSTFACSGYLKSNGLSAPFEDKISGSYSIKLSGEPTFTPVAS